MKKKITAKQQNLEEIIAEIEQIQISFAALKKAATKLNAKILRDIDEQKKIRVRKDIDQLSS